MNHPPSCLRVRPIATPDLDALLNLAVEAGVGMTTLPADRNALTKRIEWSLASFSAKINAPKHENYFFVLEDMQTQKIIGCSAIESRTGTQYQFYSFKIFKRHFSSSLLSSHIIHDFLLLTNDKEHTSEICTLFLTPSYRHSRNGEFLARVRFLFMAEFPERFEPQVIAELRGVVDEQGNSPFWEGLGRHFFNMEFAAADRLVALSQKEFIADLLPVTPIPITLLPESARVAIGQVQESTLPARKLLEREGFEYRKYVDIFDGGPTLESTVKHLRTVRNSRVGKITAIQADVPGIPRLISNQQLDLRACVGTLQVNDNGEITLSQAAATTLGIQVGDSIRHVGFGKSV